MARKQRNKGRSVRITRRRGVDIGRVAVEFEMSERDWAWVEELEDRLMMPVHDILYCAFFQGLEREGWKNPDHVTTPDELPPKRESWGNDEGHDAQISNVVPMRPSNYDDLDDDVPF